MGRDSSYGMSRPNDNIIKLPRTTPFYKRNETQICSFFIRGECIRGTECSYRHEMPVNDDLSQQNIKDRFYGVYEAVSLKLPNKTGDMSSLKTPEDESIRTLWVGGIYGRVLEQDIRDHFYVYGELESVMMVPQRACAFVTYTTRKGAEKAANELANNLEIKGLRLKLMWGRVKTPKAESEVVSNEERQQSHNGLLPKAGTVVSPRPNQMIQPPGTAASQDQQPSPLHQVGRSFFASTDHQRTGSVIPSQEGSAVNGSGENTSGGSEEPLNPSAVNGERVETRTMPSGGAKRSSDPLEAMSPQEMRERVMKRKKGGSTVVPPVSVAGLAAMLSPDVATPLVSAGMAAATQAGSAAAVGETVESLEETALTRFVTSFPRDFLLQKSGVTKLWPDADTLLFPGPMHLMENKSDLELVNDITEMTLQTVQAALMSRRRLLAHIGQQDAWRVRMAEAEASEARMSSQLRDATAQIQSLKEAVAAAEVRAAAAVEARKARESLLMTADAQLREMTEKIRQKSEEILEERKDAASSAALRARAKLMREFLDGKSSSWEPQAEIDFYVAHIGEESDLVSKDTPMSNVGNVKSSARVTGQPDVIGN